MNVFVYIYVNMYEYKYICIFIYHYIHSHTHIHTHIYKYTFIYTSEPEQLFGKSHILIVLSAEPVANHSLVGSKAIARTHPK
jgi:predicted small integral membrane protein